MLAQKFYLIGLAIAWAVAVTNGELRLYFPDITVFFMDPFRQPTADVSAAGHRGEEVKFVEQTKFRQPL